MNKKIFIALVIILIIGGALYWYFNLIEEDYVVEHEEKDEYENYLSVNNNDWGFEVKYPDDWEKKILGEETTEIAIEFQSPQANDSDMFAENVIIYSSMPQPQDFDEMMQIGLDKMSKNPDITLLSNRKVMISGHSAYVLEYSASDVTAEFKYLHYFIDGGDYWYQILYTSEISEYNKSSGIAKKIIESFIIK